MAIRMTGSGGLMVLLALAGLAVPPASAETEPENMIKYRQGTMKALAGHMGASAQVVRGKVPFTTHLHHHAAAIEALSATVGDLFPEGSDFGETEAKAEVWDKRTEFEQAAGDAAEAAKGFAAAVAGGDAGAIGKAFRSLSESCKGCHKKFREKD